VQQEQALDRLATALRYVRACLNSVILDTLRACAYATAIPLPGPAGAEKAGEEDHEDAHEYWERIRGMLPTPREQRVAYLLFHCGLQPEDIVRLYPQEVGEKPVHYRSFAHTGGPPPAIRKDLRITPIGQIHAHSDPITQPHQPYQVACLPSSRSLTRPEHPSPRAADRIHARCGKTCSPESGSPTTASTGSRYQRSEIAEIAETRRAANSPLRVLGRRVQHIHSAVLAAPPRLQAGSNRSLISSIM